MHLLFKKNYDKLKRLLDEVPAAKAAVTSPARNLMQTPLSCGSPRQIRLLMSHGVQSPSPAALIQYLAAPEIEGKDDDVRFLLDHVMEKISISPFTTPFELSRLNPEIRVQWLAEVVGKQFMAKCAPQESYESDLAILGIICGPFANSPTPSAKMFRLFIDHACRWLQERAARWGVAGAETRLRTDCFNALASRLPGPFSQALKACHDQLLAQGVDENAVLAVTGRIVAAEALRSSRVAALDATYDPKTRAQDQADHWFTQANHASSLAAMMQSVRAAALPGNARQ